MSKFKISIVSWVLIGGVSISSANLSETKNVLSEWIETERQIAVARSDWSAEKAGMESLITLYRQELETLEAQIVEANEDRGNAEEARAQLLDKREKLDSIEQQAAASIAKVESHLLRLQLALPEPLREELGPFFSSIPESPETNLSIGQRIQAIIAIMTQIQKFNQAVTLTEGFREFEAGRTVQTEKIYFGLGTAYYVDQANEHSGYAVFEDGQWKWIDDDTLIPQVRKLVDIYKGQAQAEFVDVPVSIR